MTRRRDFNTHEHVGSGRIGFAALATQTLHDGHVNLLNQMRKTCDVSILGVGSVSKSGIPGHPFTFEQRKAMIEAIFGDAFRFVPLDDIDARNDRREWYGYAKRKVTEAGLPDPTDYFSGSTIDAEWYTHAFATFGMPSQTRAHTTIYTNPETKRRLHIVDRDRNGVPSGREIRQLIEMRNDEWKLYVPERLHTFIEMQYPPRLREPISFDALLDLIDADKIGTDLHPEMIRGRFAGIASLMSMDAPHVFTAEGYFGTPNGFDYVMDAIAKTGLRFPVGTRLSDDTSDILELKDDGRWRPLAPIDEKTAWAQANRFGA